MEQPIMVVSNRLPIQMQEQVDGQWTVRPGAGGLITAVQPVLAELGGSWLGWPGDSAEEAPVDELLSQVGEQMGVRMSGVALSRNLVDKYYYGFSNETLWPMFHDLLGHAKFEEENWRAYIEANECFAQAIAERVKPDEVVWIHDYQLILVGQMLRDRGIENKIAFFLHIPLPPPDIYVRLPWRKEILEGLLAYDVIGFQSQRDRRNFGACVRQLIPQARVQVRGSITEVRTPDHRLVRFGSFPISIDYKDFATRSDSQEVADTAWFLHENLPERQLVLGVDRLDYTKGIPAKFRAFERALEKYPELDSKISMIQILVPSRQYIPEYQKWKDQIDQLTGRINGRFAHSGWMPIHYMYRSVSKTELLGYYRASEIGLVTPLKDGMNLVAKEYCATKVDLAGVLILSEFAGAAPQLSDGAVMVNPYDREGVADAIHQAFHMPREERAERMRRLRREVRRHDVYFWVKSFLDVVRRSFIETGKV